VTNDMMRPLGSPVIRHPRMALGVGFVDRGAGAGGCGLPRVPIPRRGG
jgi:hypothetical protein